MVFNNTISLWPRWLLLEKKRVLCKWFPLWMNGGKLLQFLHVTLQLTCIAFTYEMRKLTGVWYATDISHHEYESEFLLRGYVATQPCYSLRKHFVAQKYRPFLLGLHNWRAKTFSLNLVYSLRWQISGYKLSKNNRFLSRETYSFNLIHKLHVQLCFNAFFL